MSLVQHVSAVEGVDRDVDFDVETASFHQLGRRTSRASLTLSYDPTPFYEVKLEERLPPIGAYEVSRNKRIGKEVAPEIVIDKVWTTNIGTVQIAVGVVSCVLASGVVFGFAALKSVLVDEEVYRDLCSADELQQEIRICYKQDLRLNLTFTVASVTTNMSALLVGSLLDRYGPRVCGFCGSFFLFIGTLCMAFGTSLPFDAYMAGHFLLALGGTFVFVPSFHLSNAFPKLQGLILALITGAFDASAAIFLVFRLLYDATSGSFGVRNFFLIYLIVPIFILATQLLVMPSQSYETKIELAQAELEAKDPLADVHDSDEEIDDDAELWRVRSLRHDERIKIAEEIKSLLGSKKERRKDEKKADEIREASGVWGALHGLPAWKQMQTPWFILICLLTVVQMARMNWFIATVWSEYRYILNSPDLADQVNDFFDLALPIGGLLTVPFIGLLLDNCSTAVVLGLLVFITSAIGVFGVLPLQWAAYVNCALFVIYRPLYYSAMSDYAAKVFGFATFGTVYGAIICISGLCTFAQSGLQALTHDVYHNDPSPVNLGLASLGLFVGIILVAFVAIGGRKVRAELAEEDERRSLLPRPSYSNLRLLGEQSDESDASTLRPKPSFTNLTPVVESEEPSWEHPPASNRRGHSNLNYATFAAGDQDEEEDDEH